MGALLGILILVLLIVGLVSRKRRDRAWVKEERFEESGDWVDKRPGERGTWGSLDAEMTRDRRELVQQGRAVELAELVRDYAATHGWDTGALPEEQIRAFRSFTRNQAKQFVDAIERTLRERSLPAATGAEENEHPNLKKQVLDFAYRHFPALLDLDIDLLRQFDQFTGRWIAATLAGAKG